ncbi:MAG: type IX secretion system outer membrane channel protein PorV [Bacteroidota bacterium]
MKNLLAPVLSCLVLILAGTSLQAQLSPKCVNGTNPITGERCANAVTSAVPFLRITPDARGGAMGDVGIATSSDPNGMHYNQSKLAFADKNVSISATYTPWMRNLGLNDVYLAYLAGYVKLDKFQTVGLSLRYFSLGDIEFTDENGQSLGQGRPNEFEVSGAYARKLTDKLSAAVGAKFIYSNLATGRIVEGNEIKPGVAGAADISLTYKTPLNVSKNKSDLTVGLAITNLGSKITYTNSINRDFIPTNLGLGVGWRVHLDEYNTLTFTTDFNKLLVPTPRPDIDDDGDGRPDYKQLSPIRGVFRSFGDAPGGFKEELKEITTGVGAEYWYDDQFAVRMGYFYENYSKGNRKYFSVGLGVKYNIFGLNFSYLVPTTNQRNPLDNTLRFSLVFDFDALKADEE